MCHRERRQGIWETDSENKNEIAVFNRRERQVSFQDESEEGDKRTL